MDKHKAQGYLFKITKTLLAEPSSLGKSKSERRVVVEVGEIIEFRYFSPANFRTVDNIYLSVEEDVFDSHTEIFAKILDNISFRNKNTLKEIVECKLYELEPKTGEPK